MKYKSPLLLFLLIQTSSCNESENEKQSRLANEWQGKEIVLTE